MTMQTLSYLNLAREKAAGSNCVRRQVGAVIAKDGATIVVASNGTPDGCTPCNRGGCERCQSDTISGEDYDSCICIHAEQRAIALAASMGVSVKGGTMYVTLRPCIPCLNLCLHAGVLDVIYDEHIAFRSSVERAYTSFIETSGIRLRRVDEVRS